MCSGGVSDVPTVDGEPQDNKREDEEREDKEEEDDERGDESSINEDDEELDDETENEDRMTSGKMSDNTKMKNKKRAKTSGEKKNDEWNLMKRELEIMRKELDLRKCENNLLKRENKWLHRKSQKNEFEQNDSSSRIVEIFTNIKNLLAEFSGEPELYTHWEYTAQLINLRSAYNIDDRKVSLDRYLMKGFGKQEI